jgi:hypothetical protein
VPTPQNEDPSGSETEPTASEDEVEQTIVDPPPPEPVGKSRPKLKPASKGPKDAVSEDNTSTKPGPSGANKKATRNDSEVEEVKMSEKAKGKRKALDESAINAVEPQAEKKGRRNATAEVEAGPAKPRSRDAEKIGSEIVEIAKPKRTKPASKAESKATAPTEDDDAADDDLVPKKKKRKINIFPTSQPTSFPWGELPQVSDWAPPIPNALG